MAYCLFGFNLFAKQTIIVSVPPQKFFIEKIAKNNFNIKTMMEDDSILPNYKPSAQQYVWAENAVAYFEIGIYDEKKWVNIIRGRNKKLKTFDTTLNIKKISISPYVWLDPQLVRIQAKNILNALVIIDPKSKDFYRKNYFKFVNSISRLDFQIRTIFKKHKRNYFVVFDPVWDYFAKRYGLKQLEINANSFDASEENIVYILNQINKYMSNILFVPKYYFSSTILKQINLNTKIVVVPFSHLEYNWEENILNFAKLIAYQPR